ncbi:undecaprenyl diphosphate synthase family protein, partial [Candidatus Saccharibacteria bacterium]|nr:undecaprenyl diphosphate synthase family protein [Candidatus Saccharibacteria bacterium]
RNVRMVILGSKKRVSPKLMSIIEQAEKITEDCDGMTVGFCFNYGGEHEIADAANIALEADGEITPETIRKHLYHPEIPDIDMVVRTSGEERISGFMLWRASYAEFMFVKKYFPEMQEDDIKGILKEYESRSRRFGK